MYPAEIESKIALIQTFIYRPRPYQLEVHGDLSRFRCVVGVPATGKTFLGLAEALWQSYCIPNNHGLYVTQDLSFALTALHQIAPAGWLEPAAYRNYRFGSTDYGVVAIRSITGEVSRIEIWDASENLPLHIQGANYGWYVVDDVPWTWNAHFLLTDRLRRRNTLKTGLYLCSGLGFPQWVRPHACLFSTHFWGEALMVDGQAGNWTSDELRAWVEATYLPNRTASGAFEERVRQAQRSMAEARDRLWGEAASSSLSGTAPLAWARHLIETDMLTEDQRNAMRNAIEEGRASLQQPTQETPDAELDTFLEEVRNLLNAPDEPETDPDALPKSAPTG